MSKVLSVALTDTLMAWNNDFEMHMQSGDRQSTYYFRVPDDWVSLEQKDLDALVFEIMQLIYNGFNEHFRQVEPNDINYLAPLSVSSHALTSEEEAAKPWLTAYSPAVWEWTACVVVSAPAKYEKVDPDKF